MTSIYDIPYKDIQIFLLANNINIQNRDEDYNIASDLLKDKKAKGHTRSIIEWMIAHNLLVNNIDIPRFTINEIDNMSQNEINQLAKLLNMKCNNIVNIKNILRYLHKLYEGINLLPEIHDIIFENLSKLEIKDIDVSNLRYDNVINLLKTHRNKKDIRKFIYDNLEKIIIYNTLNSKEGLNNIDNLDDILNRINVYNKNIMISIVRDNYILLNEYYTDDEINDLIQELKEESDDEGGEVYIDKNEGGDLIDFMLNLIDINEIRLAKRVFDIANDFHYFIRSLPFNYELIQRLLLFGNIGNVKNVIDFIGEQEFIYIFEGLLVKTIAPIHDFTKYLLVLKKYDFLFTILSLYHNNNYGKFFDDDTLETLKFSIDSKNDDLIVEFINKYI